MQYDKNGDIAQSSETKGKFTILIRQNDSLKFTWDIIILGIAIFNSVCIPLTISFEGMAKSLETNDFYNFINLSSTVFFCMDMFL